MGGAGIGVGGCQFGGGAGVLVELAAVGAGIGVGGCQFVPCRYGERLGILASTERA